MIPTAPSPSSTTTYSGRNAVVEGARGIVVFAALLLTLSMSAPQAKAGTLCIDIYSGYDQSNAPTGGPYSGWAGQLNLSSDLFIDPAGYCFGNPFGLSSFAAVIKFTEYMSTTVFYS